MSEIESATATATKFLEMTERYVDHTCTSFGAVVELVRLINLMQQDKEALEKYRAVIEQLNSISEALAIIRLRLASKELQEFLKV